MKKLVGLLLGFLLGLVGLAKGKVFFLFSIVDGEKAFWEKGQKGKECKHMT